MSDPVAAAKGAISGGLTLRESRFVDEYLLDCNAKYAAIRAGYSERTARNIGSQLLRSPRVAAALATAITERADRTKITTDWVVVQSMELYAKTMNAHCYAVAARCLELLSKHVGGFAEKHEHTGANGEAIAHAVTVRFVRPNALDAGS